MQGDKNNKKALDTVKTNIRTLHEGIKDKHKSISYVLGMQFFTNMYFLHIFFSTGRYWDTDIQMRTFLLRNSSLFQVASG